MTEKDKAIWIKVEDARASEKRKIVRELEETFLAERYEIIVSGGSINTIGLDDLEQALNTNGEKSDGWGEEPFDPSNTASLEEMKDVTEDNNSEQTGLRCGKGGGFFSRMFLKSNEESDAAKNMKKDIENNSEFYNSLAVEPEDEED
jgi:hypothetical protein